MNVFKAFLIAVLLYSASVSAGPSYLGKAPERAVIVTITPSAQSYKSGGKAKIQGTIKVTGKSKIEEWMDKWFGGKDKGLLEEFKHQGIDIVAGFPSSATDVSNSLKMQSVSENELKFSFETPILVSNDLNQLSVKVYNNHHDKEKLKRLASIQAKLERRLALLEDLKSYFKKHKAIDKTIAIIEKEISNLTALRDRILDRLNADDNLMADNTTALQVDNNTAAFSRISTSINGFRFIIESSLGTAFEGSKSNIKAKIAKIGAEDAEDEYYKDKGKSGYLGELHRNDKLVSSKVLDGKSGALSFDLATEALSHLNENTTELFLYKTEKEKKKNRIGALAHHLSVLTDAVSPVWLSSSVPSLEDQYVQNLPPVVFVAKDSFGRLNHESFKASLVGTTIQSDPVSINVASLLTRSTSILGDEYSWSGNIGEMPEGEYILKASVSDTSGNFTVPNPYQVKVRIDRTKPVIQFGHREEFESPTQDFNLQVTILDHSPVVTSVTLNGTLVKTGINGSFSLPLVLGPGANVIQVSTKDKAGNESAVESKVIYDITPPVLSFIFPEANQKIYSKQMPAVINIKVSANEPLSSATVNGLDISGTDGSTVTAAYPASAVGVNVLNVKARDLAGNIAEVSRSVQVVHDEAAPAVNLLYSGGQATNQSNVDVSISVVEPSEVWSKVIINDAVIFETRSKNFDYPFELTNEGLNTLKVVSQDEAGNVAESRLLQITRDTTPPLLSDVYPGQGQSLETIIVNVTGRSSEPLSEVLVNGTLINVRADKLQFFGEHQFGTIGENEFTIEARDLAGNSAFHRVNVAVNPKLLSRELVKVGRSHRSEQLLVTGGKGATRSFAEVKFATGFMGWKTINLTAKVDGSFEFFTDYFDEATLTVKDRNTGEFESMPLVFGGPTILSGVVKDINDIPLPNVSIYFRGSTSSVKTNGSGLFTILNPPTGEQMLVVDGQTATSGDGIPKSFTSSVISVNIGVGQNNIFSKPIYLAAVLKDGTQSAIVTGADTKVTSIHAPGFALNIPKNTVIFPGGASSGSISVYQVPADRTTILPPDSAVPDSIILMEPSGLKFKKRVEVTLPNENELPAGTDVAILSMDSSRGKWVVDGVGRVTTDGQAIKSKEGLGISHFSAIYAVPIKPAIAAEGQPGLAGIDVSKGGLKRSVSLPSFKVLGRDYAPELVYNSTWAKPTAVVTNYFDIPKSEMKTKFWTPIDMPTQIQTVWVEYCFLWMCERDEQKYFIETEAIGSVEVEQQYKPDSISAQFSVSTLPEHEAQVVQPGESEERLGTTAYANGILTPIRTFTEIPSRAVLSFGLELKDPVTGQYLESGIYPSFARYQIKMKHLTITTKAIRHTVFVNRDVIHTEPIDPETSTDTVFSDVLPDDITSSLVVQNKSRSEFGTGWKGNFTQKILNPKGNKIYIEDEKGGVKTYQLKNTISTVFNGSATSIDFQNGFDLSGWPNFIATEASPFNSTVKSFMVKRFSSDSGATASLGAPR